MVEEKLVDAFRIMRGGHGNFLGVKSPWWAKNLEYEEMEEGKVIKFIPSPADITMAELIVLEIIPMELTEYERRLVFNRFGKGYKQSLRRCGKNLGMHHEYFRQEIQHVTEKLKIILDKKGLFR